MPRLNKDQAKWRDDELKKGTLTISAMSKKLGISERVLWKKKAALLRLPELSQVQGAQIVNVDAQAPSSGIVQAEVQVLAPDFQADRARDLDLIQGRLNQLRGKLKGGVWDSDDDRSLASLVSTSEKLREGSDRTRVIDHNLRNGASGRLQTLRIIVVDARVPDASQGQAQAQDAPQDQAQEASHA